MSSEHPLMPSSLGAFATKPIGLQPDNFTFNVWGGRWIPEWKGLSVPQEPVGESWEFSTHAKHPNRVKTPDGSFVLLPDLIRQFPKNILGPDAFSKQHTLFLLKFIDSNENLSLQVHPSDQLAEILEKEPGKSEAWYILDAGTKEDEGFIYLGFNPEKERDYKSTDDFSEAFLSAVLQANSMGPLSQAAGREKAERLILPFLNKVRVQAGEAYQVPPGTIHAIGKGVRLFEIQESSDITYRLWDWNRPALRPLHFDKAKRALNFLARPPQNYRIPRRHVKTNGKGHFQEQAIVREQDNRFSADLLTLEGESSEIYVTPDRHFVVLTCVEGAAHILYGPASKGPFEKWGRLVAGRSVLIPAGLAQVHVVAETPRVQIIKSY